MAGRINQGDKIRCSFCNKTQDQVHKLIAGPAGIFICDECIETCNDILEEEMQDYEDNDSMDRLVPVRHYWHRHWQKF